MTLHDFQAHVESLSGPIYEPTGILPVCPDLLQTWIPALAGAQKFPGSVAVIRVGSQDKHLHYPPVRIYEEVAFAAFDLFMGVITDVLLDRAPPFSVVLADWLSKTAAEGAGSRATRSRSA